MRRSPSGTPPPDDRPGHDIPVEVIDSDPPKISIISTALKDKLYFERLQALKIHAPFMQELNERRTEVLAGLGNLNINDPNMERRVAHLQGQIATLNWIQLDLINKVWRPKKVQPKRGE
jgi:hypothetical protein